jgi:hypothetical protein
MKALSVALAAVSLPLLLPATGFAQNSNSISVPTVSVGLGATVSISGTYSLQCGWSFTGAGVTAYVFGANSGYADSTSQTPCGGSYSLSLTVPNDTYTIYAVMEVTNGCTTQFIGNASASATVCGGGCASVIRYGYP